MQELLKKKLIVSLIFSVLFGDFITKEEYAKMLYFNPRGIGCNKCHGKSGEGMKLDGLNIPSIKGISLERLKNRLNKNLKKSLMPSYYLTDKEIEAIYYYLKEKK